MNTANLLAELTERGVRVESDGQSLRYFAATGSVPTELRARLRDHRADLIEALKCERGSGSSSESLPLVTDGPASSITTIVITVESAGEAANSVDEKQTAAERRDSEGV